MSNRQHLDVFAGEDRTLTLYARDASNIPVDLSGKTISWRVGRSPWNPASDSPLFTKSGTIVTAASGIFSVPVAASDTSDLAGDYVHEAWLNNAGTMTLVTSGRFRVRPALEA